MASVLFPVLANSQIVPSEPMEVDPTSPLTRGLTGVWLPTGPGVISNLLKTGGDLIPFGTVTYASTMAGPGASSQHINSGWANTSVPAAMKPTTAASVFYYGTVLSLASQADTPPLFGVEANDTSSFPGHAYVIGTNNGGPLYIATNSGGSQANVNSTSTPTAGVPFSAVGTFVSSGTDVIYYNGKSQGTVASPGPIAYSTATLSMSGYPGATAGMFSGAIMLVGATWNRALTAAEALYLYQFPFCMLRPVAANSAFISFATSNSPNIVGVSSVGAVGSLSPEVNPLTTGVAGTGQAGNIAASVHTSISGASGTGQAGTTVANVHASISGANGTGQAGSIVADVSASISGASSTGQAGNLAADVHASISGANGTGQAGSIVADVSASISGASSTGQAGNLAADVNVSISGASGTGQAGSTVANVHASISGANGTGQAGNAIADVSVVPSGVSGTGEIGVVTPQSGQTVIISGVTASSAIGTLEGNVSVPITGVTGTGQAANTVADVNTSITGVSGVGQVGILTTTISVTVSLTGVSGTGQVGTLGVEFDTNVLITGVSGTGEIGIVTPQVSGVTTIISGVSGTGEAGNLTVSGVVVAAIPAGGSGDDEDERRRKWLEWSHNRKRKEPEKAKPRVASPIAQAPSQPIPQPMSQPMTQPMTQPITLAREAANALLATNLQAQREQFAMLAQREMDAALIRAAHDLDDEEAMALLIEWA